MNRLWERFDGRPNDKICLREKAIAFAPMLLNDIRAIYAEVVKLLPNASDQLNAYFELVAVELHLVDRIAFAKLGPEKRCWFFDPIFAEVAERIIATICTNEEQTRSFRLAFPELHAQRTAEYASYSVTAQPNEKGGFDIGKTVGFMFATHIVSDSSKLNNEGVLLSMLISTHYVEGLIRRLELDKLLIGYPQIPTSPTSSRDNVPTPKSGCCILLAVGIAWLLRSLVSILWLP